LRLFFLNAIFLGVVKKDTWQAIGTWCGIWGIQIALAVILYHFFGYYAGLLWFPLFLICFYFFQKYNGND
jgi:hypothetical protein